MPPLTPLSQQLNCILHAACIGMLLVFTGCSDGENQAQTPAQARSKNPQSSHQPPAQPTAPELSPKEAFAKAFDAARNLSPQTKADAARIAQTKAVIAAYQSAALLDPSQWKTVYQLAQSARIAAPKDPDFNLAFAQARLRVETLVIRPAFGFMPKTPEAQYCQIIAHLPSLEDDLIAKKIDNLLEELRKDDMGNGRIFALAAGYKLALARNERWSKQDHNTALSELTAALPWATAEAVPAGLHLWMLLRKPGQAPPKPNQSSALIDLLYAPLVPLTVETLAELKRTQATTSLDVPKAEAIRRAATMHLSVVAPTSNSSRPWLPNDQGERLYTLQNPRPPTIPPHWFVWAQIEAATDKNMLPASTAPIALITRTLEQVVKGTPLYDQLQIDLGQRITQNYRLPTFSQFGSQFHQQRGRKSRNAEIGSRLAQLGINLPEDSVLHTYTDNFYQPQFARELTTAIRRLEQTLRETPSGTLKQNLATLLLSKVRTSSRRSSIEVREKLNQLLDQIEDSEIRTTTKVELDWLDGNFGEAYRKALSGISKYPNNKRLHALTLGMEHATSAPVTRSRGSLNNLIDAAALPKIAQRTPMPRLLIANALNWDSKPSNDDEVPTVSNTIRPQSTSSAAWIRHSLRAERENQIPIATEGFRRAIDLTPTSVKPYLAYAQYQVRIGNRDRAESIYEHGLSLASAPPTEYTDFVSHYLSLLDTHNPKKALAMRLRYDEFSPKDAANLLAIAKLLLKIDHRDASHALLTKLRAGNPNHTEIAILLAKSAPRDAPPRYFDDLADSVIADNEIDASKWLAAAEIQRAGNNPTATNDCFQKAVGQLTTEPRHVKAYVDWLLESVSDTVAIERLNSLCASGKSHACGYLARRALANDDLETADKILNNKASAAAPELTALRGRLLLAQNKPEPVLELSQKMIADSPENVDAYHLRAEAAFMLSEEAIAENALTAAMALSPNDQVGLMLMARFHLLQDQSHHAISILQSLIVENPRIVKPRKQLAELLLRTNRTKDLARLATSTINRSPTSPIWHRHLAIALESELHTQDAAAMWREAYLISRDPLDREHAIRCGAQIDGLHADTLSCPPTTIPSKSKPTPAPQHLQEAKVAADAGEIDKALAQVAKLKKDDAEGWILKTQLLAVTANPNARTAADNAIAASGQNRILRARALTNAGYANLRLNNPSKAERLFKQAIEECPLGISYIHLAHLSSLQNDLDSAGVYLRQAKELHATPFAYTNQNQIDGMQAQLHLASISNRR